MELLTYKSKSLEYTYYLKNSKRVLHGLHRSWYPDGQLEAEYNYKDGKEHGLYKVWYKDGRLLLEKYYWYGGRLKSKEIYEENLVTHRNW